MDIVEEDPARDGVKIAKSVGVIGVLSPNPEATTAIQVTHGVKAATPYEGSMMA